MQFFIQSKICLAVLALFGLANVIAGLSPVLKLERGNNVLSERGCQNNIYDVYDDKYMFFDNAITANTFCGLHIHFNPSKVVHVKMSSMYPSCYKEEFIYKNQNFCGEAEHNLIIYDLNSGFISYNAMRDVERVHVNISITFKNRPKSTTMMPTTTIPDGCGKTIYSSTTLKAKYENNKFCKWTIMNNIYRFVYIRVSYSIEYNENCGYDSLTFKTKSGYELHSLCGINKTHEYSYTDLRQIIFKTDNTIKKNDFSITVIFTNINMMTIATEKVTGRITTNKYSKRPRGCDGEDKYFYNNDEIIINNNQYVNNMTCKWVIKAKPFHYIKIHVLHFQLEDSLNCKYDYLKINNEKFCGVNNKQPEYNFSKNDVDMSFVTDGSYTADGIYIKIYYIRSY